MAPRGRTKEKPRHGRGRNGVRPSRRREEGRRDSRQKGGTMTAAEPASDWNARGTQRSKHRRINRPAVRAREVPEGR
ncbi:hypothetical protein, conserved in T. vivax, partial [Trypanosoma vivax Y486]